MIKNKLGNFVKIRTGKLDANASSIDGEYPFFTCSKQPLKISSFSYDCKCVLVAGNGDLNVKYYEGKFDAYQRTYIIESKDESILDTRYLYWFLFKYVEKLRELSIGGVIKYIKINNLTDPIIPLPPIEDQKRIVKILDEADALRQKRKQAIGLLDDYLKSVFLEMFGDPVKNEKSWETKKTSEVITEKAQNGFFAKNEHYSEFGTPVIWISDFINLPYARVKNLKRANATSKDKQQYKVKYGDVLFCRSSLTVEGIGKCSIIPENIPEDTIYECHIIKINLNKEIILPEYFREFSKTAYFRNQIMQKVKTSTMTTIAQGGILETSLLIPPMELQKSFLNVIKKQEILIDKMLLQSAELETQFQALMQKAFKGEL